MGEDWLWQKWPHVPTLLVLSTVHIFWKKVSIKLLSELAKDQTMLITSLPHFSIFLRDLGCHFHAIPLPPFYFPAYISCLFSLGVLWVWLQCSGTAWWSMNSTESGKCCTKSFPTSSSFWERSYDCRPCITEVGMITPCSRTFPHRPGAFWTNIAGCHLRVWASEELTPRSAAVISESELQRSWNYIYCQRIYQSFACKSI